jgi:hypothetical protein
MRLRRLALTHPPTLSLSQIWEREGAGGRRGLLADKRTYPCGEMQTQAPKNILDRENPGRSKCKKSFWKG